MKKQFLATSALALILSTSAFAHSSPDWNVLEIGYSKLKVSDDTNLSMDGFSVRGTSLLNKDLFLSGNYSIVSDLQEGIELNYTRASAGLGYLYAISKTTDIYGVISYEYAKAKVSYLDESTSLNDSGYGLSVGVKAIVDPKLEVSAQLKLTDFSDYDDETSFRTDANYYLAKNVAIGINYEFADNNDTIGMSVRIAF